MKLKEILKENYGFEGEYSEPYVYLLEEMCIVVSQMLDKGFPIQDAVQEAIEDFYDDLMKFDVSIAQAEEDLVRERGQGLDKDGYWPNARPAGV